MQICVSEIFIGFVKSNDCQFIIESCQLMNYRNPTFSINIDKKFLDSFKKTSHAMSVFLNSDFCVCYWAYLLIREMRVNSILKSRLQ